MLGDTQGLWGLRIHRLTWPEESGGLSFCTAQDLLEFEYVMTVSDCLS